MRHAVTGHRDLGARRASREGSRIVTPNSNCPFIDFMISGGSWPWQGTFPRDISADERDGHW